MSVDSNLASQIADGVIGYLKKIKKENILEIIIDALQKEAKSQKAYIYSPIDLSLQEKKKIYEVIKKITGENVESYVFQKDETLIDGLKIFYKDKLWDFSVSTKLNKLLKIN